MKLTGNTILITGGGSGIGLALGEAFATRGNHVVAAGRNSEKLKVADARGLSTMQVDMSDPESVRTLATALITQAPRTNVVIHNAAICKPQDFIVGNHDQIREQTVATNFLGPMRLTDALLPHLLESKSTRPSFVSSGLGFVPSALYPTYSATKAALHSYAQTLRFQLKHTAVQVVELVPPYVQTELGGIAQTSDPRAMPLREFVAAVFDILEHDSDIEEILVSRVLPHRFAAESGRANYDAFFHQYTGRFTFGDTSQTMTVERR